jgi:CheY-like chemotaxis protein
VLTNLVGNAIKFTPAGKIEVRVKVDGRDTDGWLLHFTVKDTGIGVPVDKQQLIFESFSQADASTTREYGGTGLGLSICSRLVGMMNGRLWVESEPGKGSTFNFTAKVGIAAIAERKAGHKNLADLQGSRVLAVDDNATNRKRREPAAAAENVTSTPPRNPQASLRILLAEDNPINQRVGVALLKKLGHSVDVVADGKQAVEQVQAERYDAILMDVEMPNMDGFEATVAIRAWEQGKGRRIPIVAMTAHALTGYRDRCIAAGMDGYISKPVSLDQITNQLQTIYPGTSSPSGL